MNSAQQTHGLTFIKQLYQQGGPHPKDYKSLNLVLDNLAKEVKQGHLEKEDLYAVWSIFSDEFKRNTLQGHSYSKPYGYAGDFQIIDMVYRQSSYPKYARWDAYFNQVSAAFAVRNRKSYFKNLISDRVSSNTESFKLLNIASGPARDLYELFEENTLPQLMVDCVEYDTNAISFAKKLCANYLHQVQFHHANIFKHQADEQYDLIWSAGLFDYFNDKLFVSILKKCISWAKPQSEIVIGNFNIENPSRNFMEVVLDWHLIHRNEDDLQRLAIAAGCQAKQIEVRKEKTGINLFLHIKLTP